MEPPPDDSLTDKQKSQKQAWLDKWLRLNPHHPLLARLQNEVWSFCANYAKRPSSGYRMIISGENGTGKSHSAKAIHNWASRLAMRIPLVISDDGEMRLADTMFVHWPTTVDRFKEGNWYLVQEMMPVSLLVIDDIGAEHDPSRAGMEKLYLILERRVAKWTVITTNVPPESWESKFERRIASRFLRNARHVSLADVPDYNSQ
jgi:DNA replication protein DnaC